MTEVKSGYITFRAGEILNLLTSYKDGLRPSAIRLYLAAHLENNKQWFHPNHQITIESLANKAKLATRTAQEALRELTTRNLLKLRNGTIKFNHNLSPESEPYREDLVTKATRPTPIPKRILETLASHCKGSDIVGALAHLLRCLFIKQKEINPIGFIKNSLIEKLTGLCESAISKARHWMKKIGFITNHAVDSFHSNMHGGCYRVTIHDSTESKLAANIPAVELSKYVGNTTPPPVSPIYTNNNNQYAVPVQGIPPLVESGICEQTEKRPSKPTITNIQPEDLKDITRLDALYAQATAKRWLPDCQASALNFVAAATRAVAVSGDSVRIFVGIVKKGLFSHITQAQEDKSLAAMKRYQIANPQAFTKDSSYEPQQSIFAPPPRPPSPQKAIRPERVIFRADRQMLQTPKQSQTSESGIVSKAIPLNLLAQLEAKLKKMTPV